jgi:hypothetical protein
MGPRGSRSNSVLTCSATVSETTAWKCLKAFPDFPFLIGSTKTILRDSNTHARCGGCRSTGATPRKAVKTAKGRKKVIAWLKMLENKSAQQRPEDPMDAYDFTWLWRELGVGDERR